jgi:alpha-tubulin suppressor-like RCC1 family protein
MLAASRGKHLSRGSHDHAGKGRARAAGTALVAIAATGLCLATPAAASAAQRLAPQRPAGTALAWGDDTFGELGTGGITDFATATPAPVDLPVGTRVTAVATDYDHGLAVTSDGGVFAWGQNGDGQLGDGSTTNSYPPVPVDLPAGTRITAVAAGGDYSLAVTSDGRLLAWGDNNYGQLGDGSTANSSTPVWVDLPAGTRVTAVAADGYSLAVTSDGRLLAWGENDSGITTPVPVDLPAGTRITAVAGGGNYNLAVTSGGRVLAWGENDYGQLGDGSTTDSSTPVQVDLPAGTRVTAVAVGNGQSMALTSAGSVLAWGQNDWGELGNGNTTDSSTPVAVDLPAGTRVTAIAAGYRNGLALTSAGSILAWGIGSGGELGNGNTTDSSTPVPVNLPAGTRVTAIAAGYFHSLAVAVHTSC